jgi:hypothetical protein
MKCIALLLALSFAALAQQPTMLGNHRIGETFDEWLHASHINDAEVCRKDTPVPRDGKGKVVYEDVHMSKGQYRQTRAEQCEQLSQIRVTGDGFYNLGHFDNEIEWVFLNGKAARAHMRRPHIETELVHLQDAYGVPTSEGMTPYSNLYGAYREVPKAVWRMPDGTVIIAEGMISETNHRHIEIQFQSREYQEEQNARETRKRLDNPYKKW